MPTCRTCHTMFPQFYDNCVYCGTPLWNVRTVIAASLISFVMLCCEAGVLLFSMFLLFTWSGPPSLGQMVFATMFGVGGTCAVIFVWVLILRSIRGTGTAKRPPAIPG
jgi:hypothetical protein